MKKSVWIAGVFFAVSLLLGNTGHFVSAAEPVILGVPTSLGFLEGKEGLACVNMAVEEINAKGGIFKLITDYKNNPDLDEFSFSEL